MLLHVGSRRLAFYFAAVSLTFTACDAGETDSQNPPTCTSRLTAGGYGVAYTTEYPGVLIELDSAPNTAEFDAVWTTVTADPSKQAICAGLAPCTGSRSHVVLTDGTGNDHILYLSVPAAALAGIPEGSQVTVTRSGTEPGFQGFLTVRAAGEVWLHAVDRRYIAGHAFADVVENPGPVAFSPAGVVCRDVPDACARVFESHQLQVQSEDDNVLVAPGQQVDVTASGRTYRVFHARGLNRKFGLGPECADASFSVLSTWMVRLN